MIHSGAAILELLALRLEQDGFIILSALHLNRSGVSVLSYTKCRKTHLRFASCSPHG